MNAVRRLSYTTLDVFSQECYAGSQLVVIRIPPSTQLSQKQKQAIAQEFNYPVSVFLFKNDHDNDKAEWTINIFLPSVEISLAGLPLVGVACLLGSEMGGDDADALREGTLNTKANRIKFTYSSSTNITEVAIPHDIFVHPAFFTPDEAIRHGVPTQVVESMKLTNHPAPVVSLTKGSTFCLVELATLEDLGQLKTDLKMVDIQGLNEKWAGRVGMLFYVKQGRDATGETRLRTRMIMGSFEDPATGSASAALAVYLALYDQKDENISYGLFQFVIEQGVEINRRSVMMVDVHGDSKSKKVEKVILKGSAVEVMDGSLIIPTV